MAQAVYLIDGARTPFLKARGEPGPFTPVDLAVAAGAPLLERQLFSPAEFSEVILGCVNVRSDEVNPARIAALRLGIPVEVPAWTVQRNCASGLQALDSAFLSITGGRSEIVLAGGTDALSHSPLLFSDAATAWFAQWSKARTLWEKARHLARLRPGFFAPILGLLRGLKDPIAQMSMGQTAELLAHQFGVLRSEADAYAVQSHHRLYNAHTEGRFLERVGIVSTDGRCFEEDDGMRKDAHLSDLSRLKPAFDKPFGRITAGNSSQVTDGAAWGILASEKAIKRHGLIPRARIVGCAWAGVPPEVMGLGPVFAISRLLKEHRLSFDEIDLWEINEAFAAQVLACCRAMADGDFCKRYLERQTPLGTMAPDRLNVDGGAISLGHPVGSSGTRIAIHLMHALKDRGGRYAIASACIGGGMGGALLLEHVA